MSIEIRTAKSAEFLKNRRVTQMMTGMMGFDDNIGRVNWKAVRIVSDIGYKLMSANPGARFKKGRVGGTPVVFARPLECKDSTVIIYIHGGGFVSGSASASKSYASELAVCSGCTVVIPDYPLAPEHKFPAALDSIFGVYKAILRKRPDGDIVLCGESAGANLSLALCIKAAREGIKRPICMLLHSPFADFTATLDRHVRPIDDFTVKEGCLAPLAEIYAGGADTHDALLSPIFASPDELAPALVTCCANETLYADSAEVYTRCSERFPESRLIVMKNAFHAFAAAGASTPETRRILQDCCDFIDNVHKMKPNQRK